MNEIEHVLRANSVRPSQHRIQVYQYLTEHRNHPSVDMIYQGLVQTIPTLSKTTLYNTLQLFLEKGLVSMITIDEHEARYDADTSLHGHFRCNDCGQIFDVHVEPDSWKLDGIEDFAVNESHIYLKGRCPKCLK